ncbi:tryptophan synthase subunit alpha [Gordoniibacillus kamchatkensis]|uniref:Tryptophan synthase alpha chain n=1 Tax=Gordoniibacillus kamchatkensis TaxID=1590651 RepID=A0ABR5AKS4_9BACL|nr:tryptophan synthase subunit alpha [Paenibacillus sp. VKM B-2647]KIL41555.1 tryptophan synthase subunit alpha [Paenibacillus sp. VKM B-2647]
MNLIDQKFAELKSSGQTALIPFLTVGDPSLELTVHILKELEAGGADIVELGVPYSDPLADGPVIQSSSQRALRRQITIRSCIEVAREARNAGVTLPFILFTYYNPVLQLGLERTFALLNENGISGLIVPDLPMEENEEVRRLAERHGVHLIPLVAPTSNARIRSIVTQAKGFVYCVSSLGVTGVRSEFHSGIDEFLHTVKSAADVPIAIGFGISSREQVAKFESVCDGVVVGSALVRRIEEAEALLENEATREQGLRQIREFIRQLKGN